MRLATKIIEGRDLEIFCLVCKVVTDHESIGFHERAGGADYETYRCKTCGDSVSLPYVNRGGNSTEKKGIQ